VNALLQDNDKEANLSLQQVSVPEILELYKQAEQQKQQQHQHHAAKAPSGSRTHASSSAAAAAAPPTSTPSAAALSDATSQQTPPQSGDPVERQRQDALIRIIRNEHALNDESV